MSQESADTILARVGQWVGLPASPPARRYGVVAVVDAIGTGLVLPTSVLYFTKVAQLSPQSVGLGLGIAGTVGVISNPISGNLIQRLGARQTVVLCFLLSMAAYTSFLAIHSWWAFVLAVSLAQGADRAARPAKQTFMASISEGQERVQLLAFNRSVRNVGFAAGGLLAALALSSGGRKPFMILMLGNGISYLFAAALVLTISSRFGAPAKRTARGGYAVVLRNRRYVTLTALQAAILLHSTVITIGLPLWVTESTQAPASLVGLLFALNTVLVVLLQVRATRGILEPPDAAPVYRRAGVALLLACTLFALAGRLGVWAAVMIILAGAVVLSMGEVLTSAAEFAVTMGLSDEANRGPYLAFYGLAQDFQQLTGPLIVTTLFSGFGGFGWIVLGGVMGGACLASAAIVASVARSTAT